MRQTKDRGIKLPGVRSLAIGTLGILIQAMWQEIEFIVTAILPLLQIY